MTHILVVDDEPINHELVARALASLGAQFDFARNGSEGLSLAHNLKPDLIITDVMMPDTNGYELTRLLRREAAFADTPILVLTAQSGLDDKLQSFEAGADDHLTKPFEGAELLARVNVLLRRLEARHTAHAEPVPQQEGHMIAVHSLRGGVGASTLAINLGVALAGLWPESSILLDLTMTAGQVALMLNMTLRRTWSDISRYGPAELDWELLDSTISKHESGLSFIAAPTHPDEAQPLRADSLTAVLRMLKLKYTYVLADLPHDLSDTTLQALDAADTILIVVPPDIASIRAASAALDIYSKLGYPKEKSKLILNATFPRSGLPKDKIEAALGIPASIVIPYVEGLFVEAINYGRPPVHEKPQEPVAGLLEDFAFSLSKEEHRKSKPADPSEAWKRVYRRYQARKK